MFLLAAKKSARADGESSPYMFAESWKRTVSNFSTEGEEPKLVRICVVESAENFETLKST